VRAADNFPTLCCRGHSDWLDGLDPERLNYCLHSGRGSLAIRAVPAPGLIV
jgi:hypothetical protein